MVVTEVDVFVVKAPLAESFAFSQGWVSQRAATLVRLRTDSGIEGWGEAFTQGLEPPEIAASAVRYALAPMVLGQAVRPSVLWHQMYTRTRDYGRKGSVIAAISAMDIALWDILGKACQLPIHQLLGGAFRSDVQPYATGFYRLEKPNETERLISEAQSLKRAGFKAMKIKLGFGLDNDIHVIQSIYQSLDDPGMQLMVDTNHAYGRNDAIRLGKAMEPLSVAWYEEPVVPEDLAGYQALRQSLTIPVAGGENEHTAYGFSALLGHDAVDIAQPDVGSCGGLTAARDILALCYSKGVSVNPHVWGTAIAQAASLQFIATIPPAHAGLAAREPLLEYDVSAHPFRQELIANPWQLSGGRVEIPDGPGLGISVNTDTIEKYRSGSV